MFRLILFVLQLWKHGGCHAFIDFAPSHPSRSGALQQTFYGTLQPALSWTFLHHVNAKALQTAGLP